MSERRIIVVTGSRHLASRWMLYMFAQKALREAMEGATHLIHGGASGADNIAEGIAQTMQIDSTIVRAHWRQYGKAAGPRRNDRLAALAKSLAADGHAVHCFALPLPDSTGTVDCMRKMADAGIIVSVWQPPEVL